MANNPWVHLRSAAMEVTVSANITEVRVRTTAALRIG